MSVIERVILWVYFLIVSNWPLRHLVLTYAFRRLDYLGAFSPRREGVDVPFVSAIIPAKDEEASLPNCLESVRAQTYPNLEVIVVDDRSTDGTAAIARDTAARDARVRVLTITELPVGWTGKAHALDVAAKEARGDWLWFLDADTRHAPECLEVVMAYAKANRAALASLLPEMRCETFWERLVQPLMGIVLMRSFPVWRVNRDSDRMAFANGQFILVERSAYEAAGGHEAVRDRFVEDIYLAQNVKGLGYPIRTAIGVGISSTRMYSSLDQLIRGWARILYDAFGRRVGPVLYKVLEPLVFSQTGLIALLAAIVLLLTGQGGPFATWLLVLAVIHLLLQVSVLYRFYQIQGPTLGRAAWWYPLAGLVSDWIMFQSVYMCLTGRVNWRGTAYGRGASTPSAVSTAPGIGCRGEENHDRHLH